MGKTPELIAKTRLYNNILREARIEAGYNTCIELGRAVFPNESPGKHMYVAELESFSKSPTRNYQGTYEWSKAAVAVAHFLNKDPEDLWPPEFRKISELKPIFREVSLEEARAISGWNNPKFLMDNNPGPEELYEIKELKQQVEKVLSELTPRQERIIRMRFGIEIEEHTLKEVGQDFEVTHQCILQIENKALKRLRAKQKTKKVLKEFWEP